MAMKMSNSVSRRSNDQIQSATCSSKKHRTSPFGRFKRRKPEIVVAQEERGPYANEFPRSDRANKRDSVVLDDPLDNYDTASVFEQIDELVGSLMKSRSSKLDERSRQSSITRSTPPKPIMQLQQMKYPAAKEDYEPYNSFQCFNCGEMLDNFTTIIAAKELSQIRVGEHIDVYDGDSDNMSALKNFTAKIAAKELNQIRVGEHIEVRDDDSDNMSVLTDISANLPLAADLIVLPNTTSSCADNAGPRRTCRRIGDISFRDDTPKYISFGPILGSMESGDDMAGDALVWDDTSISRLEEC